MTKSQWIEKTAKKTGISKKDLSAAYDALSDVFEETLIAGEAVQITGFGTFAKSEENGKSCLSPDTSSITAPCACPTAHA